MSQNDMPHWIVHGTIRCYIALNFILWAYPFWISSNEITSLMWRLGKGKHFLRRTVLLKHAEDWQKPAVRHSRHVQYHGTSVVRELAVSVIILAYLFGQTHLSKPVEVLWLVSWSWTWSFEGTRWAFAVEYVQVWRYCKCCHKRWETASGEF